MIYKNQDARIIEFKYFPPGGISEIPESFYPFLPFKTQNLKYSGWDFSLLRGRLRNQHWVRVLKSVLMFISLHFEVTLDKISAFKFITNFKFTMELTLEKTFFDRMHAPSCQIIKVPYI